MTTFHDFAPDTEHGYRLYCGAELATGTCGEKKGAACHGERPMCDRCLIGVHGCTGVGCYCLCMQRWKSVRGSTSGWKNRFVERVSRDWDNWFRNVALYSP